MIISHQKMLSLENELIDFYLTFSYIQLIIDGFIHLYIVILDKTLKRPESGKITINGIAVS